LSAHSRQGASRPYSPPLSDVGEDVLKEYRLHGPLRLGPIFWFDHSEVRIKY